MREIKFRAWNEENKKMFYMSDYLHGIDLSNQLAILVDSKNKAEPFYTISAELMQYTGLKDKNGKKIYEGDILKYYPYSNLGHIKKFSINPVVWGATGDSDGYAHGKHYEWTVGDDSLADVADSKYPEVAYCEVVGNIYENPELLNEKTREALI